MSLVKNERRKLFATLLNNMANGCFVVGLVAPTAAMIYKLDNAPYISAGKLELGVCIWVSVLIGLHVVAQWIIGGLEND